MPVPLITIDQMRAWEAATWASGQTAAEVIRRVGGIVARRALTLTRFGDRVLILAGRGHNGDDARQAAPHLVGREVELLNIIDPDGQLAEVSAALARHPALVIDGLFGIGLNRELSAEWTALIRVVNHSALPVLAVDVPSGLDADTGGNHGGVIHAWVTLTLGAPKAGLMAPEAVVAVGRLEVAPDIGLGPCPVTGAAWWTLPADFRGLPPRRLAGGHKGTFGHLAILAGSVGYHGAAVLAARAAQRAQPGLITVFTSPSAYVPVASQLQSVMVHAGDPDAAWPANTTAVVVGPGLAGADAAPARRAAVARLWSEASVPVVADASALDWLPRGDVRGSGARIITPHPGEAARLLGVTPAAVQVDRLGAVQRLSRAYGSCWVVLKGQHTLVGQQGEAAFINSSGNPHLAQGGAGDVLAGYLGGLLAQPAWQMDVRETIRYAVWQHGVAADELTARGANWTIEDLTVGLGQIPTGAGRG